jgi:hypothetical protein
MTERLQHRGAACASTFPAAHLRRKVDALRAEEVTQPTEVVTLTTCLRALSCLRVFSVCISGSLRLCVRVGKV